MVSVFLSGAQEGGKLQEKKSWHRPLNTHVGTDASLCHSLHISAHSLEAYGFRWNRVIPLTTRGNHGGSVDSSSSLSRARHSQRRRGKARYQELKRRKLLYPHFTTYLFASQPTLLTALPQVHDNNLPQHRHVWCWCQTTQSTHRNFDSELPSSGCIA